MQLANLLTMYTLFFNFRFVVTTWPLLWKKSNSGRAAKFAILAVFIFSALFNLPKFFFFNEISRTCPNETAENSSNSSAPCTVKHLRDHVIYHQVYLIGCHWVVLYILPLGLLVVLNTRLIRQIRRAKANQRSLAPGRSTRAVQERENASLTLNVIAIVTVFTVCQTPDFIYSVLSYPGLNKWSDDTEDYIKSIVYIFLALNASVNFIIYILFHKNVRRNVIIMCCTKACAKRLLTPRTQHHRALTSCLSHETEYTTVNSRVINYELQGITEAMESPQTL